MGQLGCTIQLFIAQWLYKILWRHVMSLYLFTVIQAILKQFIKTNKISKFSRLIYKKHLICEFVVLFKIFKTLCFSPYLRCIVSHGQAVELFVWIPVFTATYSLSGSGRLYGGLAMAAHTEHLISASEEHLSSSTLQVVL